MVLISTNWGDFEQPLTRWIAEGPGARHGRRPIAARSESTGEPLPLTVVPLPYRNDDESRTLIAAGRLAPPWPLSAWDTENWGEPPPELFGPSVAVDPTPARTWELRLYEAVHVDPDPAAARRCARALAEADEPRARIVLMTLWFKHRPGPMPEWLTTEMATLDVQVPSLP